MAQAAIERSKSLDTTVKRKYNIWRRDFVHPHSDSILKLMQDQMIMAKAYASIAKSKNESELYSALMAHSNTSQSAIGEAHSDAELHPRYCCSLSSVLINQAYLLALGFHAVFFTIPIPVPLIKQKQWVTFSLEQKTNYMTVTWLQGRLEPWFSQLKIK